MSSGAASESPRPGLVTQAEYASRADAVDDLSRRGLTEHFAGAENGVRALDIGKTFSPDELMVRECYRFEGISDPDDLAIVYALESRDGVRGTLVDAFGVYSDPAAAAVLAAIPIRLTAPSS
jgi:hypothetical protein